MFTTALGREARLQRPANAPPACAALAGRVRGQQDPGADCSGDGVLRAARRSRAPDMILDRCLVRAREVASPARTPPPGKEGHKVRRRRRWGWRARRLRHHGRQPQRTVRSECLFLASCAVVARALPVFADRGYDAEPLRELCRKFGARPRLHKRSRLPGWALGSGASQSNAPMHGCWRTGDWPSATTDAASSSSPCFRRHAYSWLPGAQIGFSEKLSKLLWTAQNSR
jgi:hypothetical protein